MRGGLVALRKVPNRIWLMMKGVAVCALARFGARKRVAGTMARKLGVSREG
jgi:hypothetical protein